LVAISIRGGPHERQPGRSASRRVAASRQQPQDDQPVHVEELAACAARELLEESGLRAAPRPVLTENVGWAVFTPEVPWGTVVTADGTEHDRFEWVTFAQATAPAAAAGPGRGVSGRLPRGGLRLTSRR
jgi:hypothetical protein